jgi:hypothetical protein
MGRQSIVQRTLSFTLENESCIFPILRAFVFLDEPHNKLLAGIWDFMNRLNGTVGCQPPKKKLDVSGIVRHFLVGRSTQDRAAFCIEYESWLQDADRLFTNNNSMDGRVGIEILLEKGGRGEDFYFHRWRAPIIGVARSWVNSEMILGSCYVCSRGCYAAFGNDEVDIRC